MLKEVRIKSRIYQEPPKKGDGIRLAIFQAERPVGTTAAMQENLKQLEAVVEMAGEYKAHLVSFPEKYITGYAIFPQDLDVLAEPVDGPFITKTCEIAKSNGVGIIYPYPEVVRDPDKNHYYDSIAFIGPDGVILSNYRKLHLYGAAERRNYSFGNELPPVNMINDFPVGILNCYECEFPSLYKHLAARGAKLVVGPTAADYHFELADGSRTQVAYQDTTKHILPGMASVYRMFVAYVNRRGWENVKEGSWEYQGNSGIWGPEGETFLKAELADKYGDLLLIGDCIPKNHLPFSPEGNHLTDDRIQQTEELLPGK